MRTGKGYFDQLIQVSTMSTDTEGYRKQLENLFGWKEPNGLKLEENEFTKYYGEAELMESYFSFYPVKGIEFEVVQPLKGKNIWQDYINIRKQGLHHILFDVEKYDETVAFMESKGYCVAQSGAAVRKNIGPARWCYFDTYKEFGYYIEIINLAEIAKDQPPKPPKQYITAEDSAFYKMTQIGFIVEDLEKNRKMVEEIFGWELHLSVNAGAKNSPNDLYYDKEADYKADVDMYLVSGVEIEFIQPISGDSVWQDYATEFGKGLHHIAFDVEDFDAVHAHLTKQGVKSAQTGISGRFNGARWAYYDARKEVGFYVEVSNRREHGDAS